MILKGSQRGGSRQLAVHLLKTKENEHVDVHELRGFSADDLNAALHEIYAVSRGTRAKQFLFSLSLSPPPQERVPIEAFEGAIEAIETKIGLDGQPVMTEMGLIEAFLNPLAFAQMGTDAAQMIAQGSIHQIGSEIDEDTEIVMELLVEIGNRPTPGSPVGSDTC